MYTKYTISHFVLSLFFASAVLLPVFHKLVHHHDEVLVEGVSDKERPHAKEVHDTCDICLFSPASFDFSNFTKLKAPALMLIRGVLSYYKTPYTFINKRHSQLRAPPCFA
jgi:hypothetical protein